MKSSPNNLFQMLGTIRVTKSVSHSVSSSGVSDSSPSTAINASSATDLDAPAYLLAALSAGIGLDDIEEGKVDGVSPIGDIFNLTKKEKLVSENKLKYVNNDHTKTGLFSNEELIETSNVFDIRNDQYLPFFLIPTTKQKENLKLSTKNIRYPHVRPMNNYRMDKFRKNKKIPPKIETKIFSAEKSTSGSDIEALWYPPSFVTSTQLYNRSKKRLELDNNLTYLDNYSTTTTPANYDYNFSTFRYTKSFVVTPKPFFTKEKLHNLKTKPSHLEDNISNNSVIIIPGEKESTMKVASNIESKKTENCFT